MSRHIFSVLSFLLLLLGCACGPAHAADGAPVPSVPLFETGRTIVPEKMGDEVPTTSVSSFDSPFLAAGSGVMVAFAEAWHTESDKEAVDIVARYIGIEGAKWVDVTEHNGNNWRTQLVLQKIHENYHYTMRRPTAVIRGDKIYLLALHNKRPPGLRDGNRWYFELAVGEITGEVGSKRIKWNTSESLRSKLTEKVRGHSLSVLSLGNHSGSLTPKGTIVFTVEAKNQEGVRGFAIMELKVDEEQWEVSFVRDPDGCGSHFFLEWKKTPISVFAGCASGKHYVKEYDEIKERGENYNGTLFDRWEIRHQIKDLTPLIIGNKTVLLFTLEYSTVVSFKLQWRIHLWMIYGSRVLDVGPIAIDENPLTSSGLPYTNNRLLSFYQKANKGLKSLILSRLDEQLDRMNSTLGAWAKNDAYLSKSCNETALEGASPDTRCVTPMPTAGLVGFFSDNGNAAHWQDEYRFMNATVKGVTKIKNGYEFNGPNSSAKWPVRLEHQGVRYNFELSGLTVVATVTIHETPKNDAPLLTVDGDGVKEPLGLWYVKGGRWKLRSTKVEGPEIEWETQDTYRLALTLHNKTVSAYIDGRSLGRPLPTSLLKRKPFDIENVFIGAYWAINSVRMTVTNVFFYNRALTGTELAALNKTIATAASDVSVGRSVHVHVGAVLLFLFGLWTLEFPF